MVALSAQRLAAAADDTRPQPVPPVDRVGFPRGCQNHFAVLRQFSRGANQVITVFGNAVIAKVRGVAEVPFAERSAIVLETADATMDLTNKPLGETDGIPKKAEGNALRVMRRGEGVGEAYANNRAGNWGFKEFAADGGYIMAGKEHDFFVRGRPLEAKK